MKSVCKFIPLIFLSILFLVQISESSYTESGNNLYSDSTLSIPDSAAIVQQQQLAEGNELYRKKCQKCHELYKPKEFRLKQWKENLDEMKEKAELTKNEYKLILGYLSENCKK